jgi:dTDP-4-amino-4,6-dideoxygalactose transaminase
VRPIPLVDVKAQYEPLLPRIRAAIDGVLESSAFILGPNVAAFEREAAAYLGVGDAVGVANGTDALVLVLDALGIGPGDEVICPAFTFYATAEAVARRGATPVFADVDAASMNLDVEDVAARVTPRTKAIIAVGSPEIAHTGVASTFSFYPTKNLFALGDGGLVSTDEPDLAERVRKLRFHGSRDKVDFELIGYNSRLDELQAAVLRVFLAELDTWIAQRREAAARYAELGLGAACELPEDEAGHAYHLFVCRSPERDRIRAALNEAGIGNAVYYTTPLHLQPALAYLGHAPGSLPATEQVARENFSVPLWAGIDAETQERVVSVVQAAAPVAS